MIESSIMETHQIIESCILFMLLLFSAFFSSAETAFTTVKKMRLRTLAEENGGGRAALALKVLDNPGKTLSAILIGNNVVNISASALAAVLAGDLFGSFAVGIATGILTVLVLLFGEIIPKTLALRKNEKYAMSYAPVIYALCIILTPLIFLVDKISSLILRVLGVDPGSKVISITEAELLGYVDVSHEEGIIESGEREMIHNMFDFSDAVARDIMIPRVSMITVDVHSGYEEVMALFREHMYTRIPVYEESTDNIIGVLNIKDMIFVDDPGRFHLRKHMREVYYTYEYKKIPDLLQEMRRKSMPISIVLNEYGSCEGMISMEDLLEEIIGQIRDEYDADEAEFIKPAGDGEYLVDGTVKLDDINEFLGTGYESEDYDSISGIIIEKLGDRIPEEGESVSLEDGTVLKVEKLGNNRIDTVRLTLPKKEDPPVGEDKA